VEDEQFSFCPPQEIGDNLPLRVTNVGWL